MHALQPTQISLSKSTIPSGRRYIACVGQAATQGASAHWLHLVTWNARRTWGNVPTSADFTYVRVTPSGTSFSLLHAVVQAWQPMHRSWSITFTQRWSTSSGVSMPSAVRGDRQPELARALPVVVDVDHPAARPVQQRGGDGSPEAARAVHPDLARRDLGRPALHLPEGNVRRPGQVPGPPLVRAAHVEGDPAGGTP